MTAHDWRAARSMLALLSVVAAAGVMTSPARAGVVTTLLRDQGSITQNVSSKSGCTCMVPRNRRGPTCSTRPRHKQDIRLTSQGTKYRFYLVWITSLASHPSSALNEVRLYR